MTALPPRADAAAMLHNDLLEHLEEGEALALHYETWNREQQLAAREVIPQLVTIIRAILAGHSAPDAADCVACGQPWPCAELSTIHRMVKDPEKEFYKLLRRAREQRHECAFH